MDAIKYTNVRQALDEARIDHSASEIHGLITGWVCAGTQLGQVEWANALGEYFATEISESLQDLLRRLRTETQSGLRDEALAFRLMLPEDDVPINLRVVEVSHWCSGFLAGFGMTGRYRDEELGADVKELLEDLARIAALSEEVPDDDDNEADLMEIVEYVRMSALMVFTECAQQAVH